MPVLPSCRNESNGLHSKYLYLSSAYIYVGVEGNEYIQSNFVAPRSRAIKGEIHLLKSGENYELIVNRNFERKGIVKNKRLS